ncbi:DUF1127 domain-containing protein [Pseudogemmobacter faecipullorum]|uniref:DUF1127 domain-containing protein n=1 Tax=Pseudogemmobacter faecipullorum TaxID=2755041 RepID=A0ABS8CL76_9RHOB|nr:DUF1127 domain-containing protein [Pseudogemmobacter faecipullorum]MCB5410111.1 DUF1127 domain-containing protein [Pseudogemmobacter faecipullorum]
MSYTNTSSAALRPSLISDLTQAFKAAFTRRRIYIRTLSELRSLSDRDLNDLGLSRSGITSVAREAAYGK